MLNSNFPDLSQIGKTVKAVKVLETPEGPRELDIVLLTDGQIQAIVQLVTQSVLQNITTIYGIPKSYKLRLKKQQKEWAAQLAAQQAKKENPIEEQNAIAHEVINP